MTQSNRTDRNRAWRRRKSRTVVRKITETKQWVIRQINEAATKPYAAFKQHRHGALTRAQHLRLNVALMQEAADGFSLG